MTAGATSVVAAPGLDAADASSSAALRSRSRDAGMRWRDWVGLAAMTFGMFMAFLDVQIVASSLAEIQAGLAASADEINWVQTAYLVAEVVMIPLSGYLASAIGTRALFTLSALGFTATSLGCAFAWDLDAMIAFRAAQGFLGGAMIPTVFAVTFSAVPAERRTAVSVVVGLVATLAPTLGPTLGGYITETLSWRWLFLVNLGPGIAIAAVAWATIDIDRPNLALLRRFDGAGFFFMALFLGSLEYVAEEGPRNDWFDDAGIVTFTAVCAASAAMFFLRTLTCRQPIVELRAFADRNFALGSLFSFIIGIGLYGGVYMVPLYLAGVRGFNSLQIGEVMAVTGVVQVLSAPVAGALSRRIDLRLMLALGLCLFGTGVWMMSFLDASWGFWEFFLPQVVRASALMICIVPINSLTLGTLPPDKVKNASGLYNLMRNLGGAVGLAAINTVLSQRVQLHWNRLAAEINPGRPGVQAALDHLSARLGDVISGDPNSAAIRLVSRLVAREAMVMTLNDCLLLVAAAFGGALLLMPLVRKPTEAAASLHAAE